MEDITGISASLPSEANNTASTTITPMTTAEPLGYPTAQQNHVEVFTNNPGHIDVEVPSSERAIPLHELKAMLQSQLEYYFSRENLATDAYLRSQMDGDQYVPITTIAKFNQIRRLTEDLSLIVEALRESPRVQVDETGEKVRPTQRSIVLILREIPESTPIKDFEELFSGENCPKFSRCEFAHNDTWYVLFETDEDAKKAYCYLREEAKTFNGKPIMARIKASLTSAPYAHSYKNGMVSPSSTEAYNPQQIPQQQAHMQYTYANIPSESYNSQQICPPFYPPTMLQAWAPTTAACVDLAAVFSMNGLSPQAAYRPMTNTNKSNYPARDRPVKSFNPQQSYLNRNDQNSRYYSRNQSYIPRQQQQQAPFHNMLNANSFDYMSYPSGSRNLHSFGFDNLNFFAPPNLCFRKLPGHSSYTSQSRHNPLVVPRNAMGVSAINTQDQSYIPVGSGGASSGGGGAATAVQFSKDGAAGSTTTITKNVDTQGKENWAVTSQKQRNKKWSKDNGTSTSNRHYSENSGDFFNKPVNGNVKPESPKFDLETASFPPLPGCMDTDVLEVDVYESRLSDIVKGTVKPSTRDSKTQTSEQGLMKDSSTLTIEETVETSDGAFSPPASLIPDISMGQVTSENADNWGTEPLTNDVPNETCLLNNSITSTTPPNENAVFSLASSVVAPTTTSNSSTNTLLSPVPTEAELAPELETPGNVPNDSEKQVPVKVTKAKPQQPDALPKTKSSDLPSPKSKTPDSIGRGKLDAAKDKTPLLSKHRAATFSNNKTQESSFSKDKNDSTTTITAEISAPKSSAVDIFSKDKVMQGHPISVKGRSFELSPKTKGPETEPTVSLLSVNGHIDSESTVSSEDEKPFRKLTYSEVAIRAKDKVEKLAQELKERERQEALVRHHRQQENAQSRQGSARGQFRDFPRRVSDRPGSRDWRDRRKPARAVSLPSAGQ